MGRQRITYYDDEKIFSKDDLIRFASNFTAEGITRNYVESKFDWWFNSRGTPNEKEDTFIKRPIKKEK